MDLIAYVMASPFLYLGVLLLFVLLVWPVPDIRERMRQAKEEEALTQFGQVMVNEEWTMAYFPPEKGGEGLGQMFILPNDTEEEFLLAWTLKTQDTVAIDTNRQAAAKIPLFLALPPMQQWVLLTNKILVDGSIVTTPVEDDDV